MNLFENTEELKDSFKLDEDSQFFGFQTLTDVKVGFSIQSYYPEDIKYKPTRTRTGKLDETCLIHVIYEPTDESESTGDVPLRIHASKLSRYDQNTFPKSRNYSDIECPTKKSVAEANRLKEYVPLKIKSIGEYIFNHKKKSFFTSKGVKTSGNDLLKYIFNQHLKSSKPVLGFWLRAKIKINESYIEISKLIVKVLEYIFRYIYGKEIKPKDYFRTHYSGEGVSSEELVAVSIKSENRVTLGGYVTSINVIVSFSMLVLVGYLLSYFFNLESKLLSDMLSKPYLIATNTILGIWIVDRVIPTFLLIVYNWFVKIKARAYFKEFKI